MPTPHRPLGLVNGAIEIGRPRDEKFNISFTRIFYNRRWGAADFFSAIPVGMRRESAVANSLPARTGQNPAKSASIASCGKLPALIQVSSAVGLVTMLAAGSASAQSASG